jgi:hypothetical protein
MKSKVFFPAFAASLTPHPSRPPHSVALGNPTFQELKQAIGIVGADPNCAPS